MTQTRIAQVLETVGTAPFRVTFRKKLDENALADSFAARLDDCGESQAKRRKVVKELLKAAQPVRVSLNAQDYSPLAHEAPVFHFYETPYVQRIRPTAGPILGGTPITLTGLRLDGGGWAKPAHLLNTSRYTAGVEPAEYSTSQEGAWLWLGDELHCQPIGWLWPDIGSWQCPPRGHLGLQTQCDFGSCAASTPGFCVQKENR